MIPIIPATEFEICVSMTDLVVWSEDHDLPVDQHPELQALFNALGANIDLLPIACQYFEDNCRAGRGALYVFDFDDKHTTAVVLDTYSEITDQLDLISLYIRCTQEKSAEISLFLQRLFNAASVQIQASQKSVCTRLHNALDIRNYPRFRPDSSFMQPQIRSRVV